MFLTVPSLLRWATTTSPPNLLVRFHDRRRELAAGMAPAVFGIGDVALPAIRRTEMLTDLGDPVELIVRKIFRHPVPAVVSEVELLGFRIPVEAHRVADANRHHFGAGAVKVDAADLAVILVMQHVVARLADGNIKLVVWSDGDELPAMGFVLGKIVVNHDRFGRIVEIVLDLLDLRYLGEFGDVERPVLEGDAVWPVETRGNDLDLALPVFVDDGIDLI